MTKLYTFTILLWNQRKEPNMHIADAISITELARILKKSRPTVYKYIYDFETGNEGAIPEMVRTLFHQIAESEISKDKIVEYCEKRFGAPVSEVSAECQEIINLLRQFGQVLDLQKIRKFIDREIERL